MLHVCTYMYMYIIQIKYKNLLMYKNKYMMINCKIRIIRHTQFKPGERGGGVFQRKRYYPNVQSLYISVCLCFVVCSAINATVDNINFPRSQHDVLNVKADFYNIAQFPNCVGAVDGTLIPIKGMSGPQEVAFVCRKNFHALNIQAVSDSKMRCACAGFYNVYAI